MKTYRMEDLRIRLRVGRVRGTGKYVVNQLGNRKEVTAFLETYRTNAGEFLPDKWMELMRECVEASGSQGILQRIKEHVEKDCAWLKNDRDREEYAMDILAGRIYKMGRAWSDFPYDDLEEHTAFVFEGVTK